MYLHLMKMCIIPGDRYCTKCRPCLVDHFVFQNNNYIFRAVISTVKMLRFYFLANIANEKKFPGIKYSMFYSTEKNIEAE